MCKRVVNFFKENFHSEGFRRYKTYEARKAYADSVLKIADKLLLAGLLSLISLPLFESKLFIIQMLFVMVGFLGGLFLRHQGLLIVERINKKPFTFKDS